MSEETKEEIVREIRDTAEGMKEFNAIQPTRYTIESWADRLDAAWKREREKYQREYDECARDYNNAQRKRSIAESELADLKKSVGNAAALMVAMKEIRDRAVGGVHSGSVDCYEIIEIAEKAMAVPARNCDKYATANEALKAQQAAFDESNFENGECKLGCPGCDDFPIKCEVRWLFAPAKEGGEA